jgi:hypothetical protein
MINNLGGGLDIISPNPKKEKEKEKEKNLVRFIKCCHV